MINIFFTDSHDTKIDCLTKFDWYVHFSIWVKISTLEEKGTDINWFTAKLIGNYDLDFNLTLYLFL